MDYMKNWHLFVSGNKCKKQMLPIWVCICFFVTTLIERACFEKSKYTLIKFHLYFTVNIVGVLTGIPLCCLTQAIISYSPFSVGALNVNDFEVMNPSFKLNS